MQSCCEHWLPTPTLLEHSLDKRRRKGNGEGGGWGGWLLVLIHGLVYAYIHSGRSVAGCCPMPPCVTLGTTEAMVTDFPREAMMFQQPYPFGIDPVCGSMLTVVRRERWRVCNKNHGSHDLSHRYGRWRRTNSSTLTPTR